jgi:hypothetical protein
MFHMVLAPVESMNVKPLRSRQITPFRATSPLPPWHVRVSGRCRCRARRLRARFRSHRSAPAGYASSHPSFRVSVFVRHTCPRFGADFRVTRMFQNGLVAARTPKRARKRVLSARRSRCGSAGMLRRQSVGPCEDDAAGRMLRRQCAVLSSCSLWSSWWCSPER